jgi:DnaJ-class molecular chaperone
MDRTAKQREPCPKCQGVQGFMACPKCKGHGTLPLRNSSKVRPTLTKRDVDAIMRDVSPNDY